MWANIRKIKGFKGIDDRAKFVQIAPGRYELIATTQAAQVQLAQ